eukprot:5388845-Amphidinium_carterae.1
MNLGSRGIDGRTAYERLHGRQCRQVAEFTEKVLYLADGDRPPRLEARWLDGLFTGPRMHSSNYFIARLGEAEGKVAERPLKRDIGDDHVE